MARLIEHAREAKAYDAYHSTTIEGYRITPEEVSAVLSNRIIETQDPEKVRARMAIAGYSLAFERVLDTLRETGGPVRIDEHLIHDLYVDLFRPSVDGGIVDAELLRTWRASPAYLRGHTHVPPSPDKLPRLMWQFEDLVNELDDQPITRAVMTHLEFVTIHPYPDGNGRLSRFLLNLALVGEGLPWVTIRVEDRRRYFQALERAQTEADPRSFARFIRKYVEIAAGELTT
jgi:Fic family protein